MTEEYDLIIIGSGSGNSLIDERWEHQKVAIVDGGTFGGTCLNFGCIPTKQYVYPATLAYETTHMQRLGVQAELVNVSWKQMRDRIFTRIDAISEGGLNYRKTLDHVTVIEEYAHFVDTHTLQTDSGRQLHAPKIVIAAGSHTTIPENIDGVNSPLVHTSDTIMRIEKLPQSLIIIGGGFIAAEFAHVFSSLGTEVTQLHRSETLLRGADELISERFEHNARKQWSVYTNTPVHAIETDENAQQVTVRAEHEGEEKNFNAELVLLAVGRTPNSASLNLKDAGYDVLDGGFLAVDQYQRALSKGKVVEGVFALGDISSPWMLKHVANAQMRAVQHNLWASEDLHSAEDNIVPAAVFTHPQIASVGLTEKQAMQRAEEEGFNIVTKIQKYGDTAYGWAMEDDEGFVKLIARTDTAELLGAHIMGAEASLLIQPLIQAMSFGQDVRTLARGQYWIHPALTEVVENAILGLELHA
ncbi:mycothione reductase [Rothia sp. P6271]|uniref:mycothione reductase n=1 Tax=Rothia sp. P6271 TaxID=3402659 RepID=UPI003AD05910